MPISERNKAWIAVMSALVFFLAVGAYSVYLSQQEVKGAERVGIWRTKKADPAPTQR